VQGQENDFGNPTVNVEVSSDPFNIYGLLNKHKKDNGTAGSYTTPPFPPGFTPEVRQQGHYDNRDPNVDNVVDTNAFHCKSVGSNTRIANEVRNVEGSLYTDNRSCGFKLKEGGSILDILAEMIKVGQTMGFSMDGCTKDMEGIIGAQEENEDLWKLCQSYGTVIDVYILNRRSKARKRFAFVRFIKVVNVDRLVGNLCALWIGRNLVSPMSSSPALVLDDTCLEDRDYENCVMGEILQFSSINNLRILLFHEGFLSVRIVHLGGLWVMIELNSPETKNKLMNHVGVASWFKSLHNVQAEFVAKERIVWIDIEGEGVPLHAWSLKRKKFCVRAKELFVWSLVFKEIPEVEHSSDDVSTKGEADNAVEGSGLHNDDEESDTEAVSDTYFGDNVVNVDNAEVQGFTPKVRQQGHYDKRDHNVDNVVDTNASHCKSVGSNTRIAKEIGNVEGSLYTDNRSCGFKLKEGGSILDIL
nr:UvrD-like helicase, ATP-binding domain, P-loop containing nucleoside triphosphate hydrolase [Tanacetum cinerariifolium]